MSTKSTRIKKTKIILKDIAHRMELVNKMGDVFNRSDNIAEIYGAIKANLIDPICHDIVTAQESTYMGLSSRTVQHQVRSRKLWSRFKLYENGLRSD